jgi:hypothetical protein
MQHASPALRARSSFAMIRHASLLVTLATLLLIPGASASKSSLDANGDGQVNCNDFPTQAAAQAALDQDPSDPYGLDGAVGPSSSGDTGVACEAFFASGGSDPGAATSSEKQSAAKGSGKGQSGQTGSGTSKSTATPSVPRTPTPTATPSATGMPTPTAATAPSTGAAIPATGVASSIPSDVMSQVEGCAVISMSAHDVAAAGCPGVGVVIIHTPEDAPPFPDEVVITPETGSPMMTPATAPNTGTVSTTTAPATRSSGSGGKAATGTTTHHQKKSSTTGSSNGSSGSGKKNSSSSTSTPSSNSSGTSSGSSSTSGSHSSGTSSGHHRHGHGKHGKNKHKNKNKNKNKNKASKNTPGKHHAKGHKHQQQ